MRKFVTSSRAIPRPTSEKKCAEIVGYTYIRNNEMSVEVREAMKTMIKTKHDLKGSQPPRCKCEVKNGAKCTNYKDCPNRGKLIACPDSCGEFCANNHWLKNRWVIGIKTYIQQDEETGWGVYCHKKISTGELIGEYTGVVINIFDVAENSIGHYTAGFDDRRSPSKTEIPFRVDAEKKGNCCRLINHSCDPNLSQYYLAHRGQYKTFLKANRPISPGEQLTFDYFWTFTDPKFAIVCKCDDGKCGNLIGKLQIDASATLDEDNDDEEDDFPPEVIIPMMDKLELPATSNFPNILSTQSSEIERIVNSTFPLTNKLPWYTEDHQFSVLTPVFIITQKGGVLRVAAGRVTEAYTNYNNIDIIVVRTAVGGLSDQFLPRFLVYHNAEDAIFRMKFVLDYDEQQIVIRYSASFPNRDAADALDGHLVDNYVEKLRTGNVPKSVMVPNLVAGSIAIGMPSHRLVASSDAPNNLDVEESAAEGNAEVDEPGGGVPEDNEQPQGGYTSKRKRSTESISSDQSSSCESSSVYQGEAIQSETGNDDEDLDGVELSSSCFQLSPMLRSLEDVRNHDFYDVMLHRLFEQAVEMISHFVVARRPPHEAVSFYSVHSTVKHMLEPYYFSVPVKQRRFLTLNHFRLACEIQNTGAYGLMWCSLCRLEYNCGYKSALRRHFLKHHSICTNENVCTLCEKRFHYPEEYRRHLEDCSPISAQSLLLDVEPGVSDALVDFTRSRVAKTSTLFVIPPGIPSFRTGVDRDNYKGKPILMDQATGSPLQGEKKQEPLKVKVQQTYTQLQNWNQLWDQSADSSAQLVVQPPPCETQSRKSNMKKPKTKRNAATGKFCKK